MAHTKYYITPKQVKLLPDCVPYWPKVFEYAKLMEQGVEFPPVKIYFDEVANRWKYNDGRHRVMAAKLAGVELHVKSKRVMGERKEYQVVREMLDDLDF